MKYVHVSAAVPDDIPALYMKQRRVISGQQAQKFNRLFGTGLKKAGFDITMLSQVPLGFKDAPFRTVAPEDRAAEGLDYSFVGFANVPLIKNICAYFGSRRFVKKIIRRHGAENVRVTCDLLTLSAAMGALDAAAKYGALSLGIITDLPEHLSGRASSGLYGRLFARCVRRSSGLITLTEAIGRRFGRPFTVIEGIASPAAENGGGEAPAGDLTEKYGVDPVREKVFFYAGGIEEAYGVKLLTDAYIKANIPDSRLVLCGGGSFAEELSKIAGNDPRIVFAGLQDNRLVTALEKEAFLLVNPRTSAGEFTRYSFPSKNLEYMSSGTPMAGFMLPGIPGEYRNHMFVPDEETAESLASLFVKVAGMPREDLMRKGAQAAEFVLGGKSPEAQALAAVSFFDELRDGADPEQGR